MRILYASDIHLAANHLHRLLFAAKQLEADCIVVGGDLIPVREWKLSDAIEPQQNWVRGILVPSLCRFKAEHPSVKTYLDFGNDDLLAARPILEKNSGRAYGLLHNRIIEISERLAIVGYMNIPPTPFKLKDWEKADCDDFPGLSGNIRKGGSKTDTGREKAYKLKLSKGTIQDDLNALKKEMSDSRWADFSFIFVAHCPPINTSLDGMHNGQHVGSLAIRRFIEDDQAGRKLHISLHGHIHEGPDVSGAVYDNINGVLCFNMGQSEKRLQALLFDSEDIKETAAGILVEDNYLQECKVF